MKHTTINNIVEIEKIINKCDVCYVGLVDLEGNPYVIPMNFAYQNNELYLHSSPVGNKIDFINNNNNISVIFSADHKLRHQDPNVACSYGMKYRSVQLFGNINYVDNLLEKKSILNFIMQKYTQKDFEYSEPALKNVKVMKVKTTKILGRIYGY